MATGAVVEKVAENVADELELAAVATRRLDGKMMSSLLVGCGVGCVIGFYIGYKYSKSKLRNEIYAEAEQDIETIRDHYQRKILALDEQDKPDIQTLLEEKGYVTAKEADVRTLRPPVPINPDEPKLPGKIETISVETSGNEAEVEITESTTGAVVSTRREGTTNVFRSSETAKDKDADWDYEVELSHRTGDIYIIHQDEFHLNESGYAQVTYGYYSKDNVLVDESDPHNALSNRDELIGTEALKLFGHGSDDYNLIYVRNDELELEFEIQNIPKSWEAEVLGLDPHESG